MKDYSTTPFEKQRRGSFVLVLPNGQKLRFKDADHRGAALAAISARKYATILEMIEFARLQPNGYVSFLDRFTS